MDGSVSFSPESSGASSPVAWITNALHALGNRRLNQITMPGTHNSATYSLNHSSHYAVDQPKLVTCPAPWPVSYYIARWSKTQDKSIAEQLRDGVRYFDIRVAYQKKDFYACHGMLADKISTILETVVEFSNEFPREPVILDFNHFYELEEAHHDMLCKRICDIIGNKLWPFSHAHATLNEAHNAGIGSIVIVYHDNAGEKQSFFPDHSISSPWPDTSNSRILREKLQEGLREFPIEARNLFVSQCLVTPSVDSVFGSFWKCGPTSLAGVAKDLNKEVVEWVPELHKERPLNVVLVDFYHTYNFVETVIQLNFSSYVQV